MRDLASLRSPLLDLLGVRHFVTNTLVEGLEPSYAAEAEWMAVYTRPRALPLAFFVPEVRVVADAPARLQALADPAFDPRQVALVEQPLGRGGPFGAGTCRRERLDAETLRLHVSAAAGGFLVLSEPWFPGWEASIGGAPATLVRTDHALMGLEVPAGDHVIEVAYRPGSFRGGAILSALGLALVAGLLVPGGRRREDRSLAVP